MSKHVRLQSKSFGDCRRPHDIRQRGLHEVRIAILARSVEVLDYVLQRLKVFGCVPRSSLNTLRRWRT